MHGTVTTQTEGYMQMIRVGGEFSFFNPYSLSDSSYAVSIYLCVSSVRKPKVSEAQK